jgi:hypothetical protein
MSRSFVIVKSLDPPETVTDALELANDAEFTAEDYRKLAAAFCTSTVWSGDAGDAELAGFRISLESTDAALFLHFPQSDVPPNVVQWLVTSAMRMVR